MKEEMTKFKMEDQVYAWIMDHFYLDQIKLERFELLPGGYLITDRNGDRMVVWWDIVHQKVDWRTEK